MTEARDALATAVRQAGVGRFGAGWDSRAVDDFIDAILAALDGWTLVRTEDAEDPCPWSWRGLPCALRRTHPSPHHIVGEQPQFAAIEADGAAGRVINRQTPSPNVPGCTCDRDNEDTEEPFPFCDMHEERFRPLRRETLALLVIDYEAVLHEAAAAARKAKDGGS
jgi:hypothetical protein